MKYFTYPVYLSILMMVITLSALAGKNSGGEKASAFQQVNSSQTDLSAVQIIGNITYNWDTSDQGWTASGPDFVRSNSFTKLGGPYSGASWVTRTSGNYTSPSTNILTSPLLDLSNLGGDGNVYISFYESISTEPSWDRSFIEFSTDDVTWHHLGILNDQNGINWYNTFCIYENAAIDVGCAESVTLPSGITTGVGWTSNGDCINQDIPIGYFGYVFHWLKITASNYPGIVGAPAVRFRYVAYADALVSFDGWAIDNFHIGGTGLPLCSGNISGNIYQDLDGSGAKNGTEVGLPGTPVELKYYNCHVAFDTTDSNGDYNFPGGLSVPGSVTVSVSTSLGISQPISGSYAVNYLGNCVSATNLDFGFYDGSISGMKFNDINNNGINDDGIGLPGFMIEVRRDSCNGTLHWTGLTGTNGAYSIPVGAGTYYVSEVQQSGYRQTYPAGQCQIVTVSGLSGSGTAHQTGIDFGNFKSNTVKVSLLIDQNGNGLKDVPDSVGLPSPLFEVFAFSKNGVVLAYDTLGLGTLTTISHHNLDTGTYVSTRVSGTTPGWTHTVGDTQSIIVTTSGNTEEIFHLDFKLITAGGQAFNDLNGNGAENPGEPMLAGWQVNVSGIHWASADSTAITDSSGNWIQDSIFSGSHTISSVLKPGWVFTSPASTYAFIGASGGDQINKNFGVYYIGDTTTIYDTVRSGWNMVSISLRLADYTKAVVFPSALSNAFAYEGAYISKDPLANSIGYWMKFAGTQNIAITGMPRLRDTVAVNIGWNLIGSYNKPVVPSMIQSVPGGIVTSKFYGYSGFYFIADTLRPAKAYWVKISQAGQFILSPFAAASPANSIRITSMQEMPPPIPTGDESTDLFRGIPKEYGLEQNFPNPFNPTTVIRYELPVETLVRLEVFNMLGQVVTVLVNETQSAGYKSIQFNPGENHGSPLPSGMYVYKLVAGNFSSVKKMILIR